MTRRWGAASRVGGRVPGRLRRSPWAPSLGAVSPPGTIGHVSDTARWVALYRAIESERPDALFRDPYARGLAGHRGEEFLRALPNGRAWAWPMIVRTAVMDELILAAVAGGVDTVLNLAAGLDARPYRLPLPAALSWVEVDFPDILAYKAAQLAPAQPHCRLQRIPADVTDHDARHRAFADVAREARRALVVSEGLLIYLPAEEVAALAHALHACTPFRSWLVDLASPRLLTMMERRWGPVLARANAPFRFAPAAGTRFFEAMGWHEVEYRSIWEEAFRLNRTMRFGRLWRSLGRLAPSRLREEWRRLSGVVLLAHS